MNPEVIEVSDERVLSKTPKVSILMITYNHADYLAEAIEGVVKQSCDFPFELIIGEDASSDATRQIALEYQKRFPEIIRVIYSENNVGMNINSKRIFEKARGEYIAYCEGDDFWIDTEKLKKQVAIIKQNPQIGIVHSNWTKARLEKSYWNYDTKRSVHRHTPEKYLSGDLFKTWHHPKILRTCTILLRKCTMDSWYKSGLMDPKYHFGDSVLSAYVTSKWQVGYTPCVTAVYRVSPNSVLRSGTNARVAFYRSSLQFDTAARVFFSEHTPAYTQHYRWDSAASLLLWGARAGDFEAVKEAFLDFKKHFTLSSFVSTGVSTIAMRLPSYTPPQRSRAKSTGQRQ